MPDLPSFQDILLASLLVGALFVVRFGLTLRRLRDGRGASEPWREAARRAATPLGYGRELEPDRRHAVRQLTVGLFFLAVGLLMAVWRLASGIVGPFPRDGGLL